MSDTYELTISDSSPSLRWFSFFPTDKETTTNRGTKEVEDKLKWDEVSRIFNQLVTDLERYENQFGMDSERFYEDFQSGEIREEHEDYYDWRVKYSSYRNMNRKFGLTR